jgi:hypothetical protein
MTNKEVLAWQKANRYACIILGEKQAEADPLATVCLIQLLLKMHFELKKMRLDTPNN